MPADSPNLSPRVMSINTATDRPVTFRAAVLHAILQYKPSRPWAMKFQPGPPAPDLPAPALLEELFRVEFGQNSANLTAPNLTLLQKSIADPRNQTADNRKTNLRYANTDNKHYPVEPNHVIVHLHVVIVFDRFQASKDIIDVFLGD